MVLGMPHEFTARRLWVPQFMCPILRCARCRTLPRVRLAAYISKERETWNVLKFRSTALEISFSGNFCYHPPPSLALPVQRIRAESASRRTGAAVCSMQHSGAMSGNFHLIFTHNPPKDGLGRWNWSFFYVLALDEAKARERSKAEIMQTFMQFSLPPTPSSQRKFTFPRSHRRRSYFQTLNMYSSAAAATFLTPSSFVSRDDVERFRMIPRKLGKTAIPSDEGLKEKRKQIGFN